MAGVCNLAHIWERKKLCHSFGNAVDLLLAVCMLVQEMADMLFHLEPAADVIKKGPAPLLHLLDYVVLIQQLYGLPGSSPYPSVLDRVSHKLAMHDMYDSSCLLQSGDITMQSRPAANCLSLLHILLIDDIAAEKESSLIVEHGQLLISTVESNSLKSLIHSIHWS